MKISVKIFPILCVGLLQGQDNDENRPLDGNTNPYVDFLSAEIVASPTPGETALGLTFSEEMVLPPDCDIHGFGVKKIPITTRAWTNPLLEDLNGDGKLDLIVADGEKILVYENIGIADELQLKANGYCIAIRSSGLRYHLSLSDLTGDDLPDLICSDSSSGEISMFQGLSTVSENGFPDFAEELPLTTVDAGGSIINISGPNQTTHPEAIRPFVNFTYPHPTFAVACKIDYSAPGDRDLLVVGSQRHWDPFENDVVIKLNFHIYPAGSSSHHFDESVPLLIDGQDTLLDFRSLNPVVSYRDYDGINGPDLIVTGSSSASNDPTRTKVYVALNTGARNESGKLVFGAFEDKTPDVLPEDFGHYSAMLFAHVNNDALLDLVVSSQTTIGPAQRLLRSYKGQNTGSLMHNLPDSGFVIGSSESAQRLAGGFGDRSPFYGADFNNDGRVDLVKGSPSGQISVFYCTAANTFEPTFASPILCRKSDGSIFVAESIINNPYELDYRAIPYDSDLDGVVEGLVIAYANKLLYAELLSLDEFGCLVLADPVEIALPADLQSAEAKAITIAMGDFSSQAGGGQYDGAIVMVDRYLPGSEPSSFYSTYFVELSGTNPPVIQNPVLLEEFGSIHVHPHYPLCPLLRDFDGDEKLDLAICPEMGTGFDITHRFRWYQNVSQSSGPITQSGSFSLDGAGVFTDGTSVLNAHFSSSRSLMIFDHPNQDETRPLVLMDAVSDNGGYEYFMLDGLHEINPEDPEEDPVAGVYQLEDGDLILERVTDRNGGSLMMVVNQVMASSVDGVVEVVEGDEQKIRKIRITVPVGLTEGDRVSVNQITTKIQNASTEMDETHKVAFSNFPILGYNDDFDTDGLADWWEVVFGIDSASSDSDDDGLLDGEDDHDLDGLSNKEESEWYFPELGWVLSPIDEDSDDDGVLDKDDQNLSDDDSLAAPPVTEVKVLTPLVN